MSNKKTVLSAILIAGTTLAGAQTVQAGTVSAESRKAHRQSVSIDPASVPSDVLQKLITFKDDPFNKQ